MDGARPSVTITQRLGIWLRGAWYALTFVLAAIAAVITLVWYRRKRDAKAVDDEGEAAKVEAAGKRGDSQEVIDSFHKSTRR